MITGGDGPGQEPPEMACAGAWLVVPLGAVIPSPPPSSSACRFAVKGCTPAGVGVVVPLVSVTCAGRGR